MSKRICVFGASITKGHSDNEMGGWTNRLDLDLEKEKPGEYSIYNLGISGDTTTDLLKRYKAECEARGPAIIVIALGNNDSSYWKSKNGNKTIIDNFKKNLEEIIKIGQEFTKEIIFVGLTKVNEDLSAPVAWDDNLFYYDKNIKEYNATVKEVASKNNLLFIPMIDLLENNDLPDGLHPSAEGHEKIFKQVKKFLVENKVI